MSKRVLITGVTGFVGGYLVEHLSRNGQFDLHGLVRPASRLHDDRVELHDADLEQSEQVADVLRSLRPDHIYHLAGYANVGRSFHEPANAWSGNWLATFNLYEAIARVGLRCRVVFTSSGLIYGNQPPADRPFSEGDTLQPASPYAASKAAADLLSYQATRHPGLDIVRVRCFNQIGPRQTADYATANFARQIAAIEAGRQAPILETGDLSGRRDFTDVRDMVRSFALLMERGRSGEAYNAGSGKSRSMREVVQQLLKLSRTPIEVRERLDPMRREDTAASCADFGKLQATTGWAPEIPFEQSLTDLLDYWRQITNRLREGA